MPPPPDWHFSVHSPFTLKAGELTFTTSNAGLAQHCERTKESGALLTVHLLPGDTIHEFTGTVDAVNLISNNGKSTWEIVMVERVASPGRR